MDEHDQTVATDIAAAVEVHRAKRRVDDAIAALAARPLGEDTADQMREVLNSTQMRRARRALVRLQQPRRPLLSIVSDVTSMADGPAGVAVGGVA